MSRTDQFWECAIFLSSIPSLLQKGMEEGVLEAEGHVGLGEFVGFHFYLNRFCTEFLVPELQRIAAGRQSLNRIHPVLTGDGVEGMCHDMDIRLHPWMHIANELDAHFGLIEGMIGVVALFRLGGVKELVDFGVCPGVVNNRVAVLKAYGLVCHHCGDVRGEDTLHLIHFKEVFRRAEGTLDFAFDMDESPSDGIIRVQHEIFFEQWVVLIEP